MRVARSDRVQVRPHHDAPSATSVASTGRVLARAACHVDRRRCGRRRVADAPCTPTAGRVRGRSHAGQRGGGACAAVLRSAPRTSRRTGLAVHAVCHGRTCAAGAGPGPDPATAACGAGPRLAASGRRAPCGGAAARGGCCSRDHASGSAGAAARPQPESRLPAGRAAARGRRSGRGPHRRSRGRQRAGLHGADQQRQHVARRRGAARGAALAFHERTRCRRTAVPLRTGSSAVTAVRRRLSAGFRCDRQRRRSA